MRTGDPPQNQSGLHRPCRSSCRSIPPQRSDQAHEPKREPLGSRLGQFKRLSGFQRVQDAGRDHRRSALCDMGRMTAAFRRNDTRLVSAGGKQEIQPALLNSRLHLGRDSPDAAQPSLRKSDTPHLRPPGLSPVGRIILSSLGFKGAMLHRFGFLTPEPLLVRPQDLGDFDGRARVLPAGLRTWEAALTAFPSSRFKVRHRRSAFEAGFA